MSKRGRSWDPDLERQLKKHISVQLRNENNSAYMNTVFEKTYSLLFEGAKKAKEQTVLPGNQDDALTNRMKDCSKEKLEEDGKKIVNEHLPEASFMELYMGVSVGKMKEETSSCDGKTSDWKRYKQLSLETMWTRTSSTLNSSDSAYPRQSTLDKC